MSSVPSTCAACGRGLSEKGHGPRCFEWAGNLAVDGPATPPASEWTEADIPVATHEPWESASETVEAARKALRDAAFGPWNPTTDTRFTVARLALEAAIRAEYTSDEVSWQRGYTQGRAEADERVRALLDAVRTWRHTAHPIPDAVVHRLEREYDLFALDANSGGRP